MMTIHGIDHYTLRVEPAGLARLNSFYCEVLGLCEGARPNFDFPGHWLYAGGRPIVHLAGNARAGQAPPGQTSALAGPGNGPLDHISLRSSGLAEARERLAQRGIEWAEAPVPGVPLHQVFLHDPTGLKIELTFDAAELESAGPHARARPA